LINEEKKKGVTVKISYIYDNKPESPTKSSSSSSKDGKAKKKYSYSIEEDVYDSEGILSSSALSSSSPESTDA